MRTSEKKEFNNLQLSGLSDEMDSKSCRSTDNSKPSSTLFKDKFVKIITKYSYPSEPETVSNNKEVCAECGIDMKGISNIVHQIIKNSFSGNTATMIINGTVETAQMEKRCRSHGK